MLQCPNPSHADGNPSAVIYMDSNNVYCPVCGESWDIFDVAGLLDGIALTDNTFPDRMKAVQSTLGMSDVKPAGAGKVQSAGAQKLSGTQKKKSGGKPRKKQPPKIIPLTREAANEIFDPTTLVKTIKQHKMLDGDVKFVKVWLFTC